MSDNFSKRFGYTSPPKEITIREDAPSGLRSFVIQTLYSYKLLPSYLRRIICRILKTSPDDGNWSEYPNIEQEVKYLIEECEWFKVYDIIEGFYSYIEQERTKLDFQQEINEYFLQNGIGWKLVNGIIEIRGDEIFESSVKNVTENLNKAKLYTAQSEIKEAIKDLSRRPSPDITGAIQHSLASLECVCREAFGDRKSTLGELMKKAEGFIPKPLDQAVGKIWGYTSEQGRHLREGEVPDLTEAELVVELSAAISNYLSKRIPTIAKETDDIF